MGRNQESFTVIRNFLEEKGYAVGNDTQAVMCLVFIAECAAEMSDDIREMKRKIEKMKEDLNSLTII